MKHRRIPRAWMLLIFATYGASGCPNQKDRITVHTDGGVSIEVEFDTTASDRGIAVPSFGWSLADRDKRRVAVATFGPGWRLPQNFARPGDPMADTYLQFPTEVTREARADGTYYHFRRVYPTRVWARVQMLESKMEEEVLAQFEDLDERDVEDLSLDEKAALLQGFTRMENTGWVVLVEATFRDLVEDGPQDCLLGLLNRTTALLDDVDYEDLASRIYDDDSADGVFEEHIQRWESVASGLISSVLEETCGYNAEQRESFTRRLAWYRARADVGGSFDIEVEMPGTIIGSNADSIAGSVAKWHFGVARLGEEDVQLMVSSFVSVP